MNAIMLPNRLLLTVLLLTVQPLLLARMCPAPDLTERLQLQDVDELTFNAHKTFVRGDVVVLRNEEEDVMVSDVGRVISSKALNYNTVTRDIEVEGKFRMRQGDVEFKGRDLRIEGGERVLVEDVELLQYDKLWTIRIGGIDVDSGGDAVLEDVSITSCPRGIDSWRINVGSISSKADAVYGEARRVRLMIKDHTVLMLPYIPFPRSSARRSGLLFPQLDYTSDSGLFAGVDYYINLRPHYDATIGMQTYSKRGAALKPQFRYQGRRSSWLFEGSWMGRDMELDNGKARWLGSLDFDFLVTDAVRFGLQSVRVSDKTYFRDFGNNFSTDYDRIYLPTVFEAVYVRGEHRIHVLRDRQQSLLADHTDWERLWGMLSVSRWNIGEDGLYASAQNRSEHFRQVGERGIPEPINSMRRYHQWQIGWDERYLWGRLHLAGGVLHRAHTWNIGLVSRPLQTWDTTVGEMVADVELHFVADNPDHRYGSVMTPRLSHFYRGNQTGQERLPILDSGPMLPSLELLFEPRSFFGYDRFDEQRRTAASVEWNFFALGREYLGLTLAGAVDDVSDGGGIGKQIWQKIELHPYRSLSAVWTAGRDERGMRYRSFMLGLYGEREQGLEAAWVRFSPSPQSGFVEPIKTVTFSGWKELPGGWNVYFGGVQDSENDHRIYSFGGVEYRSCCWSLRFGRTWRERYEPESGRLRQSSGLFFEFRMHRLASIGRKMGKEFERWMPWRSPAE
ncbi:MAG: LPS assembly protein LptD [Gammaproteobacteria bacterium AqS3]|nr:LPS assembly protein LptD [Gammaproteobacteria bacterium AqS3]